MGFNALHCHLCLLPEGLRDEGQLHQWPSVLPVKMVLSHHAKGVLALLYASTGCMYDVKIYIFIHINMDRLYRTTCKCHVQNA